MNLIRQSGGESLPQIHLYRKPLMDLYQHLLRKELWMGQCHFLLFCCADFLSHEGFSLKPNCYWLLS